MRFRIKRVAPFSQSADEKGKLQPSTSLISRFHPEPHTPYLSHGYLLIGASCLFMRKAFVVSR